MPPTPTVPQSRRMVAYLCWFVAAALLGGLVWLAADRMQPVSLTDSYGNAQVSYSASQRWVWFPDDCVDVSWTVKGAIGTIFFTTIHPGVPGGDGVRSIFFGGNQRVSAVKEDALGGMSEMLNPAESVERSTRACIDYPSEPKLRVLFSDGASRSYKLGLDSFFARLEVWLALTTVAGLTAVGALLNGRPHTYPALRLGFWLSSVFLVIYAVAFLRFPGFWATYPFDGIIFFAFAAVVWGAAGYSLLRPNGFDHWASSLKPGGGSWVGILLFWLWVLAFGYHSPDQDNLISEYLWMPFFLWALVVGSGVLWWARPRFERPNTVYAHPRRTRLILALVFAALSIGRDVVQFRTYGISANSDSMDYVSISAELMQAPTDDGIPPRIFPYLLMNHFAGSNSSPLPLIGLQSLIAASAVGLMVYVLSGWGLLLTLTVGALLAFNTAWGTYNRTLLTESGFTSFHVICFAMLLWHTQRFQRLPWWEMGLFGALCAWTFLFRGTSLPLMVPLALFYYVLTRQWRVVLPLLAGFALFLLLVVGFNRFRYGETGLVGAQPFTLSSAVFSYHLFSPENGEASRRLDAELQGCVNFIDYDDVPAHISSFIYGLYLDCVANASSLGEMAVLESRALREIILAYPFDYVRELIYEAGVGLHVAAHVEADIQNYESRRNNIRRRMCDLYQGDWCDPFLMNHRANAEQRPLLHRLETLLLYPTQPYLVVEQISSRTPVVMLFAFLMFITAVWLASPYGLMVGISALFILYQLGTTALVHVFLPRYGIIYNPFFIFITGAGVAAVGTALRSIRWQPINRRGALTAALSIWVCMLYLCYANPTVQRVFTIPILAQAGFDGILQKYALHPDDFGLYRMAGTGAVIAAPEIHRADIRALVLAGTNFCAEDFDAVQRVQPPVAFFPTGVIRWRLLSADRFCESYFSAVQQENYDAWQANGLPGHLRDLGVTHLLVGEQQRSALTAEGQTALNDPANYRRIGAWNEQQLYEIVGEAREVYDLGRGGQIVIVDRLDVP